MTCQDDVIALLLSRPLRKRHLACCLECVSSCVSAPHPHHPLRNMASAFQVLPFVQAAFRHAASSPGASVASMSDDDFGVPAHVERMLSTPDALDEARVAPATKRRARHAHSAVCLPSCRSPTRQACVWSACRQAAWSGCAAWCVCRHPKLVPLPTALSPF